MSWDSPVRSIWGRYLCLGRRGDGVYRSRPVLLYPISLDWSVGHPQTHWPYSCQNWCMCVRCVCGGEGRGGKRCSEVQDKFMYVSSTLRLTLWAHILLRKYSMHLLLLTLWAHILPGKSLLCMKWAYRSCPQNHLPPPHTLYLFLSLPFWEGREITFKLEPMHAPTVCKHTPHSHFVLSLSWYSN